MSILRKRGKEKLRFRIMNNRVTNRDFKYLKRLFMECLYENPDIAQKLDNYYKLIRLFFFFEMQDKNVVNALRDTLNDETLNYFPRPDPAFAQSRKNTGIIIIFLKHLREFSEKRKDIENIESYQKNGLFEELCHLVEQKGDSGIHPRSYGILWMLYKNSNLLDGNEIIAQLDRDRNHYEVYSMMLKAYPNDWVERYSKYCNKTPDQFKQQYDQQKTNTPINIVYARLITDLLRSVNFLFVAEKAKKENLTEKSIKLLDALLESIKQDIKGKKMLIEKDMGNGALSLVNSLDETIFKTPESFFSVVLDLWKILKLI